MRFLVAVVLVGSVIPSAQALSSVVSGSYYHARFEGRPMACGGRFDNDALTAATNHHPCGTRLLVSYNDRDVVVRVTDRCGRCGIDLSRAAARELGLVRIGRAPVRVERLAPERPDRTNSPSGPGAPSSPSTDAPAEWLRQRPNLPTRRAGHVGAIPTGPIPSIWIMRD